MFQTARMVRVFRIALILSLVLVPASVVHGVQPTSGPVRIGISLGLTGRLAEMARMQRMGYELWVRHANEAGGLLGRRIELLIRDDESDEKRVVDIYRGYLEARLDLLFAPYSSSLTEAVAILTEKESFPILAAGASADDIWQKGHRNLFGVYTPASRYTTGFLEMVVRRGYDDVAVVCGPDSFSRANAEGVRSWASRFGMRLALDAALPPDERGLQSLALRIRTSRARVVVVCGLFEESVAVRRALAAAGHRPEVFYATVGPSLDAFRDALGPDADGVFTSTQWEQELKRPSPEHVRFVSEFLATYSVPPSYHAAAAYAAGQILQQAVAVAGTLDLSRLRSLLGSLDTSSILGRYGVDRQGMQIRHFPLVSQWQDGRREIVWPKEFQTAEPRLGGR